MSAVRIRLAVAAAAVSLLVLAPGALAAGTVTVSVTGVGSATGPGINCTNTGGDCSEAYANITYQECDPELKPPCHTVVEPPDVTLTAGGDSNGFVFDGWTGCDGVSARSCTMTVTASRSVTARFRDNQVPIVAAPTPSSGTLRGTVTLATTASDNAGVSKVEFYNGATKLGEDGSAPYELAWNTTTVGDGAKSVTARAYDATGNVAVSSASSFTVDNTAPAVNVTTGPNNETYGPGSTQTWTFSATDVTSAVSGQCSVVATGAAASFGACSGGTTSHTVSNRPDGAYTFSVRATDAAGNVSTTVTRAFAIDATPPETAISSGPADGSSSTATSATFGFTASQAGSTFECRVYPAALTPPAFGACSSATSHTATGFAPGVYSFEVRARDPFGNLDASPAKRTFTVAAPGTGSGTGTGTVTGTTTATPFDPPMAHGFDFIKGRAVFYKLQVRDLPAGSKLVATCKGKGCGFKRKAIAVKGPKVNALKTLKTMRLKPGAVLTLTATSPTGQRKVGTWRIAKRTKVTYRCAAAGGKLGRC